MQLALDGRSRFADVVLPRESWRIIAGGVLCGAAMWAAVCQQWFTPQQRGADTRFDEREVLDPVLPPGRRLHARQAHSGPSETALESRLQRHGIRLSRLRR